MTFYPISFISHYKLLNFTEPNYNRLELLVMFRGTQLVTAAS